MKLPNSIPLFLLIVCLTSCGTRQDIDNFRNLAAGGATAALADTLGADGAVTAAAGAGGFLISKLQNGRQQKLIANEVREAREEGRQQVMREQFDTLYQNQQGGVAGDFHQVNVPFDEYVTSEGVLLEPHEKTILAR